MKCGKFYSAEYIKQSEGIPRCACGGIVKPDVMHYEEPLNENVMISSVQAISNADLMIVAGTSLTVYPAAGLLRYFRGKHQVLINRDETPYDDQADLVFHESLGTIFAELQKITKKRVQIAHAFLLFLIDK